MGGTLYKAILKPLEKIEACENTYYEHVQIYTCRTNAKININLDEISEGKYFDLEALNSKIKKNQNNSHHLLI